MSRFAQSLTVAQGARREFVTLLLLMALLLVLVVPGQAQQPSGRLVCALLAGSLLVCLAWPLIGPASVAMRWHWAYLLLALFGGLVMLQQASLPREVVAAASPRAVELRSSLLADLGNEAHEWATLSIYPHATREAARDVMLVGAVFLAGSLMLCHGRVLKFMLAVMAVVGLALATLGLLQAGYRMAGAASILPRVEVSAHVQAITLTIGATLALLLIELREEVWGKVLSLPQLAERLSGPKLRRVWFLVVVLALELAAVIVSPAKQALAALLGAGVVTALFMAHKRGWRSPWRLAVVGLMACLVSTVLLIGAAGLHRHLWAEKPVIGLAASVQKSTLGGWHFPLMGAGLGTGELASGIAEYRESSLYMRVVRELGVLGLALLLACAATVVRCYWRCVCLIRMPSRAAAFGLGLGLMAAAGQAAVDCGSGKMLTACLGALLAGILVGLDHLPKESHDLTPVVPSEGRRLVQACSFLVICAISVWMVYAANRSRIAQEHFLDARALAAEIEDRNSSARNSDYVQLLSHAQLAAQMEPANVAYAYWLGVYRWQAISRVTDGRTAEIIMTPKAMLQVQRIVQDLDAARRLCPTYAPVYCMAGQLRQFVLGNPDGAELIRLAGVLNPRDAAAHYSIGVLAAVEDKRDQAVAELRQAAVLDHELRPNVLDAYISLVDRPSLAVEEAGRDRAQLEHVAMRLIEVDSDATAGPARRRLLELLLKYSGRRPSHRTASTVAHLAQLSGQYELAVAWYGRACTQTPKWRTQALMAQCLTRLGRPQQAARFLRGAIANLKSDSRPARRADS